ncbi:MAG: hypothetical protein ACI4MQ_01910 [Candidatus Coproplasma sp.]
MQTPCLIALILSAILFVFFIVFGCLIHFRHIKISKKSSGRKTFILTSFQVFLVGFFLSAVVMFFPVYYHYYFDGDAEVLRGIKSVLLSIHNTMRLFILDGDFEIIQTSVNSATVSAALEKAFSLYAAMLFVIAPVLTAGFALSFFKNVSASVKYRLSPKSDIYVMSELNERSIALAEDILTNPEIKGRKTVLFAGVFDKEEEEMNELVEKAKQLGAICFKKDVTEIGLKPKSKGIKRKIYFVGDNEDANVQQALTMISSCRENPMLNTKDTHLYVVSSNVESEVLLNSADNGQMHVRRVRKARNFAIDTLRRYSIFDTSLTKDGKKLISIVIVGLGHYGTELLKAICWCGQMDGYILQIHVFEEDGELEKKIESFAPELIKYNHMKIEGEPFYDIFFHENVNVKSQDFLYELSSVKNISTVYVCLGDDELNIETAMRMRMQFSRDAIKFNRIQPSIYAIVYSSIKSETFSQNGGLKSIKGVDYDIKFIGSMKERYTLSFIEQSELEAEGLKYHLVWAKGEEEVEKEKANYDKYEYYRRASISKALHVYYRKQLGLMDIPDLQDKMLEHNRWNAYTRAEGYIYDPVKDDIAKTHKDLIPYGQLSEREKAKDKIIGVG